MLIGGGELRLLFDDRWFGTSGIGRYASAIINRKPVNIEIKYLQQRWQIKNPVTPWLIGMYANKSGANLFWSPGFMPPVGCRIPFVVTIHDLIHLHYGTALHKIYYNQVIRPALQKASLILTVSDYSRTEILNWSSLPPERIKAIYLGVDNAFCAEGVVFKPCYPYILYVGNRRKYKNIERLMAAFKIAKLDTNVRLAFSGTEDEQIIKHARKLGIYNRITFLGHIPEVDLPGVYRGAVVVAYVSLYEGFGLPPLEAMACGTPVLTSNVTSIPEVVGDAALTVDPYDVEAIADGLQRLVSDTALREDLRRKGLERAKLFSWEKTARETWKVLEEAANS